MPAHSTPLGAQVQVIKPDRTNYWIGIIALPVFALASAVFTGWMATMSLGRANGSDFFVVACALACWIGVMSFALTNAANMMCFEIRLSPEELRVKSLLHSFDVKVDQIQKVYYIHNFWYKHVMMSTPKGNISISSLLWANEVFEQFAKLFLAWSSDKGVSPGLDFDSVSKLTKEQKAANRSLLRCLRRDWGSYLVVFVLLVAVCYAACRGLNVR